MKDVILITTCISVTDAYYYDIMTSKMISIAGKCFFFSLPLLVPNEMLQTTILKLHPASSKNKREAKWLESTSWRSKSFQFI